MAADGYRAFVTKHNELQELEARKHTDLHRITTECAALTITLERGSRCAGGSALTNSAAEDGSALSIETAESTLSMAQIQVDVHRINRKIDDRRQGGRVRAVRLLTTNSARKGKR